MALEIKVGPPQLAIHQGFTVYVTEPDGSVAWPSDGGLYYNDTRLISAYAVYANGHPWDLLNSRAPAHYGCRIYLTNGAFPSEGGDVAARTLSFVLSRSVDGGLHEQHELTNHGRQPIVFNHEVSIRSDFADIFEVKAKRIVRRGRITSEWSQADGVLTTSYRNGEFLRGLRLQAKAGSAAVYANGRLTFSVSLQPGETWQASLRFDLVDGDTTREAPPACILAGTSRLGQALEAWRASVPRIETRVESFAQLWRQAVDDMAALRLPVRDDGHEVFVPAAGLPWFVALFGRDTLITSLQTIMLGTEFARGTLDVLARWQAKERDDYRDAEPGKIMHELRRGELAYLKLIPHTPYYGTADATPLFLMLLHATWKATGDLELLRRHRATAEGCLSWIDDYGDRDGDGFQEYGTRSGQGYENVGWKDSGDAVVDAQGGQVHGPKALCELQGYVYAAWRGMAEIYTALGDPSPAAVLTAKADAMFSRFNAAFWDEADGFYAYTLDGAKKPIFSVASNPGHLLWCGIVPPERVARVVARLRKPDMWSGWGIRTLSADNPAFNPYDYQVGAVWPHDNSLIALGCARYGYTDTAGEIAGDVHRAASYFAQCQLPELYSGLQRDEANFPVQYLGANVPQAWAAGSVFALVQAMLGLEFDLPNRRLVLRPALPDWLPDLTVRNLRVGDATLDLAFHRDGDGGTRFTVLQGDSSLVVSELAMPRQAVAD